MIYGLSSMKMWFAPLLILFAMHANGGSVVGGGKHPQRVVNADVQSRIIVVDGIGMQVDHYNEVVSIDPIVSGTLANSDASVATFNEVKRAFDTLNFSAATIHPIDGKFYATKIHESGTSVDVAVKESDVASSYFLPSVSLDKQIDSVVLVQQHDGYLSYLYMFARSKSNDLEQSPYIFKLAPNWDEWQVVKATSIQYHITTQFADAVAYKQSTILLVDQAANIHVYNTITNEWVGGPSYAEFTQEASSSPALWVGMDDYHVVVSRNNVNEFDVRSGSLAHSQSEFGTVNMTVLVVYLLCVLLIGLFFTFKNRNTEDYFLGGHAIPWWAAACSIYATMLSSLTYVALPAIVFQTNWVLLIGIWMLAAVAPMGIYIAMPFFRKLNIYSAYEYLSARFNHSIRVLASGLFALFHVGRMGIVMALTALALSAVTPLSATECVLIMGGLCLLYCTLGGIEAVIWTDTIQTIVLLAGAILCFGVIVNNIDGGWDTFVSVGMANEKFTLANLEFSAGGLTELTLLVIVLGGIGQNVSSYIADQAVVQRYLVTPNEKDAARSIWANAIIGLPGALLFFLIGTGLYVFYKTQPEKLDPTIQIDQIFPGFISTELPVGIAGLIIAGIFAAAQSTVSTSMNSVATTVVTDIIKPLNWIRSESAEINWARAITFTVGGVGTAVGLVFIDPAIRSLMEEYFKVIGMFMGALGGLFILGAVSKRANAFGATVGLLSGVGVMLSAWKFGWANGYIYASLGITTCVVVGYLASLLRQKQQHIEGLTLFSNQFFQSRNS